MNSAQLRLRCSNRTRERTPIDQDERATAGGIPAAISNTFTTDTASAAMVSIGGTASGLASRCARIASRETDQILPDRRSKYPQSD